MLKKIIITAFTSLFFNNIFAEVKCPLESQAVVLKNGVNLSGCNLSNRHIEIQNEPLVNVKLIHTNMANSKFEQPLSISHSNLDGSNFEGSIFIRHLILDHTSIKHANFDKVIFRVDRNQHFYALFCYSNPDGATFKNAFKTADESQYIRLCGNFKNADFSGANLKNAFLKDVLFNREKTNGTDFSGATWMDGRKCSADSISWCR